MADRNPESAALALAMVQGCWCAKSRKRCTYHEGFADGYESAFVAMEPPPRPTHSRHPTHYCIVCSDGSKPGPGCINCRQTGMDQTPCLTCREVQSGRDRA